MDREEEEEEREEEEAEETPVSSGPVGRRPLATKQSPAGPAPPGPPGPWLYEQHNRTRAPLQRREHLGTPRGWGHHAVNMAAMRHFVPAPPLALNAGGPQGPHSPGAHSPGAHSPGARRRGTTLLKPHENLFRGRSGISRMNNKQTSSEEGLGSAE